MIRLYDSLTCNTCDVFCEKDDLAIILVYPVCSMQALNGMSAMYFDFLWEITSRALRAKVKYGILQWHRSHTGTSRGSMRAWKSETWSKFHPFFSTWENHENTKRLPPGIFKIYSLLYYLMDFVCKLLSRWGFLWANLQGKSCVNWKCNHKLPELSVLTVD